MAKIDVIMPQMGESIAEGTLSRWMKKVGDAVKRDEPMFEISTDKVDAEIPAPPAGVLVEILVQEGQTVAVQTVVARIETEAGAAASAPAPAPAAPAPPPRPSPAAPEPRPGGRRRTARPGPAAQHPRRPAPGAHRSRNCRGAAPPDAPLRWSARWPPSTASTSPPSPGSGPRRPGDQEGHPELTWSRPRRPPLPPRQPGTPARPPRSRRARRRHARRSRRAGRRSVGRRPGRAVEPDPEADRRSHGHVAPGLGARQQLLRDRLTPGSRSCGRRRRRSTPSAGVNLTYLAFIAKAIAENLRKHPVVNAAVIGRDHRSSAATSTSASRWRSTGASSCR